MARVQAAAQKRKLMSRVFISYSHKDVEIVRQVNDFLQKNRILTWFDEKSIEVGDKWQINIATSIASCDVFLLFNSKNYSDSEYCQKEFKLVRDKSSNTAIVIVDLDGSRHSFVEVDINNYQQIAFDRRSETVDDLCKKVLANNNLRRCLKICNVEFSDEGVGFLNWISNMCANAHWQMLEPLLSFWAGVSDKEKEGVYISKDANFSSLVAHRCANGYCFALEGEGDFCTDSSQNSNLIFAKNVLYALFKLANTEYSAQVPQNMYFAKPFRSANHRFSHQYRANLQVADDPNRNLVDEKIYELFNGAIEDAYQNCKDMESLIDSLYDVCQASKFFETQEAQFDHTSALSYETTPMVLHTARTLFVLESGEDEVWQDCIPDVVCDGDQKRVACDDLIAKSGDVFLHVRFGCGITSLLKTWFKKSDLSLYIDLGNLAYRGRDAVKKYIGDRSALAYRLNYYDLFNFSAFKTKITLLIDNFDSLSASDKQNVVSEIKEMYGAFRVVLPSTSLNADGKLSLTADYDTFSHFEKYSVLPLGKKQIVAYVVNKLSGKGVDTHGVTAQFDELDCDDRFFEVFDNFTKINLLLDAIGDGKDFSIYDVKDEFDSKILVYKKLFEGDGAYSIPKKISAMFKDSVVNIEDVILKLVWSEIDNLKKTSYASHGIDEAIPVLGNSLRFRDYYPVLNKIADEYYFLNDDVRSYFAASYAFEQISQHRNDKQLVQETLQPIKNDFHVLKYLKEFDVLSVLNLDDLLSDCRFEQAALTLYKISQYYDACPLRKEFLSKARFEKLPDKFFFGAENLKKISVPPCVTEVGRAVFANCFELEEIDFAPKTRNESGAKELCVKPWAIINCPKLKLIKLGDNYLKYNHPLASRCFGLEKIIVSPSNPAFVTEYNDQMLVSKDKKRLYFATNALRGEVRIPDSVEVLETNALSYLKNVEKYVIPPSVKEVSTNFSDFCDNLGFIEVEKGNPTFYSDENGYMYCNDQNGKTLFRVPSGIKDDVVIPNDVVTIGSDSISCCMFTKHIFVPDSVRYIENYAFADTYSLESLQFEGVDDIFEIGNYVFLSTNEGVRIKTPQTMTLKKFNETFCTPLGKDKARGKMSRRITFDDFANRGIEILRKTDLNRDFDNVVVVRDITLFNKAVYAPSDFNIMIVGMTEYNAIMAKDPVSADKYVEELINNNHIKAVLFTRDLPLLAQFEGDSLPSVALMRTDKSSTGAARIISEIIHDIGG